MAPPDKPNLEETKKEETKYNEQGILLSEIISLTKDRQIKSTTRELGPRPSQAISAYKDFITLFGNIPGSNVCMIDSNDPSGFLNLLKSEPVKNDVFLKLTTFELSALVPLIRLFKIFYLNNKNNENDHIPLEIPFDTTSKNIVSGENSIFETSTGRGTGVGITSLEWKQNPKNEAATSTYKLTLNFHLQNIEEFFKIRNSVFLPNGEELNVQLQDLLYQRRDWRQKSGEGAFIYDPQKYEIKLIVGWNADEHILERIRQHSDRTPEETQLLIDTIKRQKEVLYLSFVSHAFEFNEDGSVSLQINYFGRSDIRTSDITQANIMTPGLVFQKKINEIKQNIKNLESESQIQNSKNNIDINGSAMEPGEVRGAIAISAANKPQPLTTVQQIQNLKKQLEELQGSIRVLKFTNIVSRLFEKKHIYKFVYDEELAKILSNLTGKYNFKGVTSAKSFENFQKENEQYEQRKKEIEKKDEESSKFSAVAPTQVSKEALDPNKGESLTYKAKESLQAAETSVLEAQNSGSITDNFVKNQQNLFEVFKSGDTVNQIGNKKSFAFFRLSSLIDVVLEPIMNTNEDAPNFINKKLRTILGPMTIYNYSWPSYSGLTYKTFDSVEAERENQPTYVKIFNGQPYTINIGDIPISLTDFTNWFAEKYVNKDKQDLSFSQFITDLMNDFIITCINNEVYPHAPKQKSVFKTISFSSITNNLNEAIFSNYVMQRISLKDKYGTNQGGYYEDAGGFRINQNGITNLKTNVEDIKKDEDPNNPSYLPNKDYLVMFCINEQPINRTGNFEEDRKLGIYHLYPTESRSIMRSVKFSRVDNKAVQTANIVASMGEGQGVSKIIREKYNVQIEMFGNVLIEPGTLIFLRPTYTSAGGLRGTEKLLREIGLGGYYVVTEIQNIINTDEFKTTIRGSWSAFADGRINDGTREYSALPADVKNVSGILEPG